MIKKSNPRRSFFLKGLLTLTGATLLFKKSTKANSENDDTIRLIGKDGQVYEVNKKHINKEQAEKATNSKLKSWLKF